MAALCGMPTILYSARSAVHRPSNDFKLIPTVKMETRHPIEGSFGSEFSAICNHCRVMGLKRQTP